MPPPVDRSRGRRTRRALVLILVFGAGAGGAAWRLGPPGGPVEAVRGRARDYLAIQRVKRYADVLRAAGEESGVDPYLLGGVMVAESSGRVDARSSRGALGLFQLLPETAAWRADELGLPRPTEEELLSDAGLNARLGADQLAWLLRTYDQNVERALIAYNLGPGRLKEYVDRAGGWDAWRRERAAAGDSELLAYAARVRDYAERFRARGLLADGGEERELLQGR
jgi:soluble lytic murein transglycosylase